MSDTTEPFNMKVSCSEACKHAGKGREMCSDECVIILRAGLSRAWGYTPNFSEPGLRERECHIRVVN